MLAGTDHPDEQRLGHWRWPVDRPLAVIGSPGSGRTTAALAAACAALIALSCLGIVGRYPYYTIPRTAQMLVCLCALHLAGDALERVGSRLEVSRAAPKGDAG